jgi:hypothetical protein
MYQIYFLSIVINLIVGIALSAKFIENKFPVLGKFIEDVTDNSIFRLWLGSAAVVVGVFKLLMTTPGDVRIIGDMVPALAGIIAGASLIFEYYREKKEKVFSPFFTKIADILIAYRPAWGVLALAAAVLHFFFHRALFL